MRQTKLIIWTIIMVLFITLFATACSSTTNNDNDVPVNGDNSTGDVNQSDDTDNTKSNTNDISVEEQVLLDKDGIIVTLKSISMNDLLGPSLKVLIENNGDQPVTVQVRDFSVNGVMVDPIFSSDIATGKKANDEITIMSSSLEVAGIETIKDIEFKFNIINSETWETIYTSDVVKVTTSVDDSFVQKYDDSGFVAFDKNGYKIVVKKLNSEDSFWGSEVYVYIENNSDTDATIQVRDVSVNGFMIDPMFSSEVLAGKKAYDTITFLESDLTDNGIETIDTLELRFHIFDSKSWDSILDSEKVTVTFGE